MKTLEDIEKKPEKGGKTVFWAVAIIAGLIGIGIVALLFTRPTTEQYQQQTMEGAFREGSPEFAALTRKIVAETDADRTTESPVAMGTIQMSIWGKIRNLSDKTLTGLEVKVTVVDLAEKPVKDKTVILIPTQQSALPPSETMSVKVIIDGFKKEENRANIRWKVTAIKVQ